MKSNKIVDFIVSVKAISIFLTILAISLTVFSQENQLAESSSIQNKKCSDVVEGLEFCAGSTAFNFNLGDKVIIPLSLHNKTQEEKFVKSVPEVEPFGMGYPPYEFSVTDENGNKFPTIEETLAIKGKIGTLTEKESNELFFRCCFNKGSRWGIALRLVPEQEFEFEVNLSGLYNFSSKGKYYLESRRNVLAQNNKDIVVIRLERISIEIK